MKYYFFIYIIFTCCISSFANNSILNNINLNIFKKGAISIDDYHLQINYRETNQKISDLKELLEQKNISGRGHIQDLLTKEEEKIKIYNFLKNDQVEEASAYTYEQLRHYDRTENTILKSFYLNYYNTLKYDVIDYQVRTWAFKEEEIRKYEKTCIQYANADAMGLIKDDHGHITGVLTIFTLNEFKRAYSYFIQTDQHEKARDIVSNNLYRSCNKTDKAIYETYKTYHTKNKIKRNRHYQRVLKNDRSFNKYINRYLNDNDPSTFHITRNILAQAKNYSRDQLLKKELKIIKKQEKRLKAAILDSESKYNLKKLTSNKRKFKRILRAYLRDKNASEFSRARGLADSCFIYSNTIKTKLSPQFFKRQINTVISKIIEFNNEKEDISNKFTKTKMNKILNITILDSDSINPYGVYKHNDNYIVISKFPMAEKDETLRKALAIRFAKNALFAYTIKISKKAEDGVFIPKSKEIIPYIINEKSQKYLPLNEYTSSGIRYYQSRVRFTKFKDKSLNRKLLREYVPPVDFDSDLYRYVNQLNNPGKKDISSPSSIIQ